MLLELLLAMFIYFVFITVFNLLTESIPLIIWDKGVPDYIATYWGIFFIGDLSGEMSFVFAVFALFFLLLGNITKMIKSEIVLERVIIRSIKGFILGFVIGFILALIYGFICSLSIEKYLPQSIEMVVYQLIKGLSFGKLSQGGIQWIIHDATLDLNTKESIIMLSVILIMLLLVCGGILGLIFSVFGLIFSILKSIFSILKSMIYTIVYTIFQYHWYEVYRRCASQGAFYFCVFLISF